MMKLSFLTSLLMLVLLLFGLASAQETVCEAGFQLIEHAMGQTRVPGNPQRVVVLDTGELDSVLALGVKPVGAVEAIAAVQKGNAYPVTTACGRVSIKSWACETFSIPA